MIFLWEGIDKTGSRCQGQLDAQSKDDVLRILHRSNITVIKIAVTNSFLSSTKRKGIKAKLIADFLTQLNALINASVPIVTALNTLANDNSDKSLQKLILTIKQDVEGGTSLSKALQKHSHCFNELLCNLIAVGEKSGTLDTMLDHIAAYIAKTAYQRRKFLKALFYPIAVVMVALIVCAVLLVFVIPKFKDLFLSFGAELPLYTRFILGIANNTKEYGGVVLMILTFIIISFIWGKKKYPVFSHKIDELILSFPIYGRFLQKVLIADYARILAITFKAGLPLLEALTLVSSTMKNWRYRQSVLKIKQNVSGGQTLHAAMQAQNLFPARVIQLVTIGEESGSLDDMLTEIANHYDAEVDAFIDNLNNLLEPMLMVILGIIVGSIVIAMYLPIFRLGSII